jgi:hypothetical protein
MTRAVVVGAMYVFAMGVESLRHVTRHVLGLYHGMPRARAWRQLLSDSAELKRNDPGLLLRAVEVAEGRLAEAA